MIVPPFSPQSVCLPSTKITLLIRTDMPNNIIRQPHDLISSSIRHLAEALCLSLVLECVAGEVNAGSMHVCLDDDIDATDTVEMDFFVLVLAPVAHADEVFALGVEFLVAFDEDGVFREGSC